MINFLKVDIKEKYIIIWADIISMISSQKDSFLKAYKEGKNFIPITQTWPADLETPLSTWLKLS